MPEPTIPESNMTAATDLSRVCEKVPILDAMIIILLAESGICLQ